MVICAPYVRTGVSTGFLCLMMLHNFLRKDGVLFVSIDENEYENIRVVNHKKTHLATMAKKRYEIECS